MQDFKWKKDESDWLRKKKDEISHSLPVYSSHLPQGGTAISYDWIWRWSPQSPCNQNKTNPKHKHEDSKDRELVVEING